MTIDELVVQAKASDYVADAYRNGDSPNEVVVVYNSTPNLTKGFIEIGKLNVKMVKALGPTTFVYQYSGEIRTVKVVTINTIMGPMEVPIQMWEDAGATVPEELVVEKPVSELVIGPTVIPPEEEEPIGEIILVEEHDVIEDAPIIAVKPLKPILPEPVVVEEKKSFPWWIVPVGIFFLYFQNRR